MMDFHVIVIDANRQKAWETFSFPNMNPRKCIMINVTKPLKHHILEISNTIDCQLNKYQNNNLQTMFSFCTFHW